METKRAFYLAVLTCCAGIENVRKMLGPVNLAIQPRSGQPQSSSTRIGLQAIAAISRAVTDILPVHGKFAVATSETSVNDITVFEIGECH
jgi:hypothetical protein